MHSWIENSETWTIDRDIISWRPWDNSFMCLLWDMKGIRTLVGHGFNGNVVSTSGRVGPGGQSSGNSGQEGKNGSTTNKSTPNKRGSLVIY